MKRCECNGHLNSHGGGECKFEAKCGSWCYVDEDASCLETKPSTNSEFHWTCEACNGGIPTTKEQCTTVEGEKCVFPFKFDGVKHHECILGGFPTPWCSTRTDGVHIGGKGYYGDCSSKCPGSQKRKDGAEKLSKGDGVKTRFGSNSTSAVSGATNSSFAIFVAGLIVIIGLQTPLQGTFQ